MTQPLLIAIVVVALAVLLIRPILETIALRNAASRPSREHDLVRIASYFFALPDADAALPARVWSDLDMDAVFQSIDRTASWPGQHHLYARLRAGVHSERALLAFDAAVTALQGDESLRDRIASALAPLDDRRASMLPALFQQQLPRRPAAAWMFPVLSLAGPALLIGVIHWPILVIGIAVLALCNAFIRVAMREQIDRIVPAMRMLPAMLHAASDLALIETPALVTLTGVLRDAVPRLRWTGRAARWLSFDPTGGNELAGYVYEYANLLFLLDVTAYALSLPAISAERRSIQLAYDALGELDAVQAVARLRAERAVWTRPETTMEPRTLEFSSLVHPLLANPVSNSLSMRGRSVLLTGSNMSGKSTFIRTVGVNAILAQTIGMVYGERWRGPPLVVRTSIGRADSITEGRSYYQAEVETLGALLAAADRGDRLILLDELFRGTNAIERVAGAKAVLAELDRRGDLVIIATHDAELLELLPTYAPHHFREEVRDGELSFDYRLHDGACSTRNALAILALAGYPERVVADARETAERLERRIEAAAPEPATGMTA
ncbi:MAG: hypothetical protein V4550_07330 [Gemmatimonadota bacterium]